MAGQDLEVEDGKEKVKLYNISLRLHGFLCLTMYITLVYCCCSTDPFVSWRFGNTIHVVALLNGVW